jgi:threonine/homoserine/homoserine lactone efflux protein
VIETAWYFVYALAGRSIATLLEKPSPRRIFNRVTGGAFIVFGLAMAGARA